MSIPKPFTCKHTPIRGNSSSRVRYESQVHNLHVNAIDFHTVLTKGDCTSIFTAGLLIIDKSREDLKCSSIGELNN